MTVPAEQAETAAFLEALAGSPPTETHISAVFRGPDTVWKLKKAVRLGFLDFSAIDRRRHFLARELALNAPFVPGLYRDVVPVTRTGDGLILGGYGPAVDWVLRMARVPEADFLDQMAVGGHLDAPLLTALADVVAAMHALQPLVAGADPVAPMQRVASGNAAAARAAGLNLSGWEGAIARDLDRVAPLLCRRAGLVRRAHGDLHLGNLLLWQGRPAPFDALEFDEAMATIDPGYDLAFLLMDLDRLVSRAAANHVLCRYVARTGDAGLVGALPPFLSLRAMIRAHVEAAKGVDGTGLVRLALDYLQPMRPAVVAIGGLMGTGKSTLARALAPALGPAPGALVLRSDEIRKRLAGLSPEQALLREAYTPAMQHTMEAALLDAVGQAAAGGHAAIADTTFLDPALRAAIRDVAHDKRVPFIGLWLDAPLPELERRIAARRGDASDATVDVLRAAAAKTVPPDDWLRLGPADTATLQQQVQRALPLL